MQSSKSTPNGNMLALTAALGSILPCEIRHIIYSHLLDDETMSKIHSKGLWKGPSHGGTWPTFLKPGAIDEQIREEIVRAFCKRNKGFEIGAGGIDRLFRERFFQTNVTLEDTVLSALTVTGCLNRHTSDSLRSARIAADFAPLLKPKQQFASGFTLNIWFSENWRLSSSDMDSITLANWEHKKLAYALMATLKELQPIVKYIEGLGSSRKVKIELGLFQWIGKGAVVNITADMRERSEDEWYEALSALIFE